MKRMSSGGRLVVISGPSGVGKSAICAELLTLSSFRRVITCTTRSPRDGEVDGRDYHFLSDEAFEEKIERGEFLEHAAVHGHRYGTLRAPVEASMAGGHCVLLPIDVQGARELRRQAGLLGKKSVELAESFLFEGDRVVFGRNSRRLGVANGDAGTVVGIASPLSPETVRQTLKKTS